MKCGVVVEYNRFIDLTANNFDSLESIIDAFEEKYGNERKIKTQANENDKDLIKGLTQMIKDMQFNEAQLIKTMEENHVQAIKAMEVNHSNQIQNRLLATEEKQVQLINTMETNHAKEIIVMKANQMNFQNRLEEMERLQVQNFQLRTDYGWEKNKETNHKPPDPLNKSSSHYEEFIYSIEKWLIDGDLDSKETEGNQVYSYEIDPSPMSE